MSYLNCPQCGLSVRARPSDVVLERCPRCLAKTGQGIPMYRTPQPRPPFPATGARSEAVAESTPRSGRPTPRVNAPASAPNRPDGTFAAMTAATIRAGRARRSGGTFAHLRGARRAGARVADLRAADLRDPDARAADLRAADLRAGELRAGDLRAGDASAAPDNAPPGADRQSGGELTSP